MVLDISKGKLPPQAVELEEGVIGAMLIDERGVLEGSQILFPDVFYKPAHQIIYSAIETLISTSDPVDLMTVSEILRKKGNLEKVGGDFYLVGLSQKVSS